MKNIFINEQAVAISEETFQRIARVATTQGLDFPAAVASCLQKIAQKHHETTSEKK